MDGDRYRAPERRVLNARGASSGSGASVRRLPEEPAYPQQPPVEQEPPRQEYARREPVKEAPVKKKRRTSWLGSALVLLLVLLLAGGVFVWKQVDASNTGINGKRYQAVFLSNGQHYFGKLKVLNSETYALKDVYYLEQVDGSTQADLDSTAQQTTATLKKLGETEAHGPEDTIFVPKQQVLLYENLKDDSQVVKLIDEHKQQAR